MTTRPSRLDGRIGKYVIVETLEETASSVWYRGRDPDLERDVVIEVLRGGEHVSKAMLESFVDEARRSASLNHPNVITIYDAGVDEGRHYVVMQRARGRTLDQLTGEFGRLDAARSLRILHQVAAALDAAHAHGLVHGSLGARYITVHGVEDAVVVSGFGRVEPVLLDRGEAGVEAVYGVPAYMSPELARGEAASPASDIYSLAAMAFETLSGRPPFPGSEVETIAAHLDAPPPRIDDEGGAGSSEIAAVLQRGMAKALNDRWPSAEAMVRELERALQEPAAFRTLRDWTPTRSTRVILGIFAVLLGMASILAFRGSWAPGEHVSGGGDGHDAAFQESLTDPPVGPTRDASLSAATAQLELRGIYTSISTDTPPAASGWSSTPPAQSSPSRRTPQGADLVPNPRSSTDPTLTPSPTIVDPTAVPRSEPADTAVAKPTDKPEPSPPADEPRPTQVDPTDEPEEPDDPDPTPAPPPVPPTEPRPARTEEPRPTIAVP